MQAWQSDGGLTCAFCSLQQDWVDHLFFSCHYSQLVVGTFQGVCFLSIQFQFLDDLVSKAAGAWKGKSIASIIIYKLIYHNMRRSPRH